MPSLAIQRAATLFTLGAGLALLLPALSQDGMFMDGELYAAVAHNMANGIGSFWAPRFSIMGLAGQEVFHEHPPLVFGLQSLWFKMLGSAFWVERSYAFCMALVTASLIVGIWRQFTEATLHSMAWWPILLWISIPTVFWCFHNNMHENTMGVFTTGAVACCAKARHGSWRWVAPAGLLVFLASLAKGLPGLFPVAAPILLWLGLRQGAWSRALLQSAVLCAIVGLLYGFLLLHAEAAEFLWTYVRTRLLHRIAENPTVEHRFATLEMLLTNLAGPLILCGAIWLFQRRRSNSHALKGPALAFTMIGLSGVLPLMLTMVQKSFYMAAALPMLALALAFWSGPMLAMRLEQWAKGPKPAMLIGLAGILTISVSIILSVARFGQARRDAELLKDIHLIGSVIPPHSLIGLEKGEWNNWSLQTYLMRYHFISLKDGGTDRPWLLTTKDGPPAPPGFEPVELGTKDLMLWVATDR